MSGHFFFLMKYIILKKQLNTVDGNSSVQGSLCPSVISKISETNINTESEEYTGIEKCSVKSDAGFYHRNVKTFKANRTQPWLFLPTVLVD